MSSEGGKIKAKRRQAPSKPYDRNLTLFGKLRKSVKDLLIPSWLLGSHESEAQATGDACQTAQASSLSAVGSNSLSSGTQLHNRAGDGVSVLDQSPLFVDLNKDQREKNMLGISGYGEGSNVFLGESYMGVRHTTGKVNSVTSDIQGGDLVSQRTQDVPTTSKLSGAHHHEPQQVRAGAIRLRMSESYLSDADDQSPELTGAHHIMTSTRVQNQSLNISQTVAKRQRLWSPESKTQGKHLMSPVTEKPAFNSILLGSLSDSAVFGDSFNKSLFYPGKTRFGGASAERRTSLNTSLPYQSSLPLRKQVRAHHVSNNVSATTSATAQRILETLDRMSTPLGDAKKIPVSDESANDSVLTFTPSSYRRINFQTGRPITRPLQLPSRGPPTSQHQALAQAVIARNRYRSGAVDKRQTSTLEDDDEDDERMLVMTTSQEPEIMKATVSSETRTHLGHNGGAVGKMKAKRFSHHVTSAGTGVDTSFKFTSPIKTLQTKTSAVGAEGGSKTCQEPAVGASSGMPQWTSSSAFTASVPAWGSIPPKPKMSSPDIGGTSSSFKSYSKWGSFDKQDDSSAAADTSGGGFSLAPAASLKTGSVMDILGAGKSLSVPASEDLMAKFKKPVGSWECDACMIVNKLEATKCVCCDTARPGAKPAQTSSASDSATKSGMATSNLSSNTTATAVQSLDSFKTNVKMSPESTGSDASALSKNLNARECITSDAGKLVSKQTQNGTGISSENSLSALFKKPAGAWECDTCMVQNTAGASRCIACDSSKPGLQSAGIVSKAPVSSSGSSAIAISPAGGFTFNTSSMTTTTSGSGGFKFGNAISSSTPSTSLPPATGFIFGQTTLANKDSSSKSSMGSSASTPLTSGFKFGASSPEGDSGGTASRTSSFGTANSNSGFVFGNSSSNAFPAKTSEGVLGSQAGEAAKVASSDVPDSKPGSCLTTGISSQSNLRNNGIASTTDLSKSNSFVSPSSAVFQFGNTLNAKNTSLLPASSGVQQPPVTELNSNDNNSKMSHQEFNFAAASSAAPPSFMTAPSQSLEKPTSTMKPASTLFQFGASSVIPAPSTGLGMGNSLSATKPVVNGGFGSSFEVQPMKDDSNKTASITNQSFGNFAFGATSNMFGGYGQAAVAAPKAVIAQTSQSSKRSVDFDSDQPTSKKSFNFGGSVGEPPSNGLFAFSGSSESKASPFVVSSTAGPFAGGFMFNSTSNPPATQTGGPAPGSGFQFSQGSLAAPAFQGFNLSFKAQNEGPKSSFEATPNKGPVSFSATPNFNFGGAIPQQTSVFQFGAKPVETSVPAADVFAFGAAHPSSGTSEGTGFVAPGGLGTVGNFSIGTGESAGRKMKKAMRRIKK